MADKIVDLTHTLDEHVSIYPGDPAFMCHSFLTIPKDGVAVSTLNIGSHTGTHIDAPSHFIEDGMTIDKIPLNRLIGAAVVVDLANKLGDTVAARRRRIEWEAIAPWEEKMRELSMRDHKGARIVLIRTGWDRHWGTEAYFDHPFLSKEAAERILATGIGLIGVDTLSPDATVIPSDTDPHPKYDLAVHDMVLGNGGLIVENLTGIDRIVEGEWIVSVMPLKIGGCDGSPVRACAWRSKGG